MKKKSSMKIRVHVPITNFSINTASMKHFLWTASTHNFNFDDNILGCK